MARVTVSGAITNRARHYREVFVTVNQDHHYVPQFLLRAWCNDKGKLTVYERCNGRVVTSERAPKNTAFEPNLYAAEQVPQEKQNTIEIDFMTPGIDTPAALIVQKILNGGFASLTLTERSDFVRFLLSLLARHPDAIDFLRRKGPEILNDAFARDPEDYLAVKGPSSASTLPELVREHAPGLIPNFGLSVLARFITHEEIGERIFCMPWWVHDMQGANTDLVISDRPCFLYGNVMSGNCLIALPLSPTMLFFACNREQTIQILRSMNPTKLVKAMNESSVISAAKRVYGIGSYHLLLVDKYLARSCSTPTS